MCPMNEPPDTTTDMATEPPGADGPDGAGQQAAHPGQDPHQGGHDHSGDSQNPPPRQLRRRSSQQMVGGVCAGLGEYFRVDPVIFRIGFVAAIFAGGLGILAYVIAWVVMPDADADADSPEHIDWEARLKDAPPWFWLLPAAATIVLVSGFAGGRGWSVLIAGAIIGGGILMIQRDTASQHASAGASTPAQPAAASEHQPQPWTAPAGSTPGGPPPTHGYQPPPPEQPSGAGWSPITRITLAGAVASVAIMAAIRASDGTIMPVLWTAVPLVVIGAGLIIGAFIGRGSRSLIGWGATLTVLMLLNIAGASLLTALPPSIGGGEGTVAGQVYATPGSISELRGTYSIGAGEVILDLTRLDADDLIGEQILIQGVVGSITVLVDEDVPVEVRGRAGIGALELFDSMSGGLPQSRSAVDPPGAEEFLSLDMRVGIGEAVVERVP